jgi:aminopeptidase YwaD
MDVSNRFELNSMFFCAALLVACGASSSNPTGGDPGPTGGAGTGGASGGTGGGAMADAADDVPRGAMDAPVDRENPGAQDGSSSDVSRDRAVAMDARGPDTTTTPDAIAPPSTDVASDSSNPEDLIRELLGRFQVAEIEAKNRELESKSIPDRFTKSAPYTATTEWIRDWLAVEAPAAVVRFDEWEGYRNIEIVIPATDPTAGMYILGGHLDSVRGTVAMDDNGSGALGVAIMARELSHYRYKGEIRCLLFDAEEGGLIGSAHYAQALKASGCQPDTCLKVYINLDEVAYDPQSRRGLRVWSDVALMHMLHTQVNTTYALGMSLTLAGGSCHRSDDCSFSEQGYATVYNFQATQSPYYHMPGDTADTLNYTTLTKVLQLSAGVVATAAVPIGRAP